MFLWRSAITLTNKREVSGLTVFYKTFTFNKCGKKIKQNNSQWTDCLYSYLLSVICSYLFLFVICLYSYLSVDWLFSTRHSLLINVAKKSSKTTKMLMKTITFSSTATASSTSLISFVYILFFFFFGLFTLSIYCHFYSFLYLNWQWNKRFIHKKKFEEFPVVTIRTIIIH